MKYLATYSAIPTGKSDISIPDHLYMISPKVSMAWFILNLAESLCLHLTEKFTSTAFHRYHGQSESCFLLSQWCDPPSLEDHDNMAWKRSRSIKWWKSLWKAVKYVFRIQSLGGLVVGLFAIGIVVLELNFVDLCYEPQNHNWTSVPKRIQNIIVTANTIWSFPLLLWKSWIEANDNNLANATKWRYNNTLTS